jgi:two-component system LytT family response regulator
MIRALIADDEPLARRKIRGLLAREPDVEIAGECGSGPEAARLIRELEPNLVFLDIEMPELDGLSLL